MRRNIELTKDWKIVLNAETAGKVEMVLTDPLTKEPIYGARKALVNGLLEHWLDKLAGKSEAECKPLPTLEELRSL